MQWFTCKYSSYLTILILVNFIIMVKPLSTVAQDTAGTETTACKLKSIVTHPQQTLVIEKGKDVNVTVKVKCKGNEPAAGVTVGTAVLKGGKKIALSPASAVTDESGNVIFTVSGNKKTDEEPAEIQFIAGDLRAKLAVSVQTVPCVLGSIKISPEQVLILEQGKSGTVTVKTKCENDSPAVDVKVDARVQEGGDKIALSSTALLTDESGNAVFTVAGNSLTKKNPAKIQFTAEDFNATLNVKVAEIVTGDAGTGTAALKPKTIETHPEQTLVMEKGKNVNATVKVKYKGNEPAVGVTVNAAVLKGKKKIEISPASAVTDENGKVVFTVSGNKKTDEEPAEVQFIAGDLQTKLEVRVQTEPCVLGSIKISPEQVLTLEQGQSGTVTVKTKCKSGSPAVDVKVGATIQEGSNKIALSSTALLTDESGNAVFVVTGNSLTKKNPAKIQFTAEDFNATLNVKVAEIATGDAGTGTAALKPKTIETHPDQTLVIEKGKDVNVTVKVKYKGNEPAVGVTVNVAVLKGKKKIEISPASAVTDESGKVVFTVAGNAITDKELAEVQFTAGELQTTLEVRVQTTECVVGSIKTNPEQALELEQGKNGTVMVKTKCKNGSPAVDVKVGATIQEGSNKIALSSTALLTDASGNAIFTVTGNSPTKKNPAKIQFTAGDLKTTLNVKVKAVIEETKP